MLPWKLFFLSKLGGTRTNAAGCDTRGPMRKLSHNHNSNPRHKRPLQKQCICWDKTADMNSNLLAMNYSLQSVTELEHLVCVKAIGLLITSSSGMLSSTLWETLLWFPNPTLPLSPCDSCSHSLSHITSLPVFLRLSHVCINLSLPASSITVLPPTTTPRWCDHFSPTGRDHQAWRTSLWGQTINATEWKPWRQTGNLKTPFGARRL